MVGSIDQAVGAAAERDLADVSEIRLLRVAQVLHERAGGADGGRAIAQPEPVQRLGPHLRQQRASRGLELERPSIGRGHPRLEPQLFDQRGDVVEPRGDQDFARPEDRELVGERLTSVRPERTPPP